MILQIDGMKSFGILTAMAFKVFLEENVSLTMLNKIIINNVLKVDVAIVEVGIGGIYDSTIIMRYYYYVTYYYNN